MPRVGHPETMKIAVVPAGFLARHVAARSANGSNGAGQETRGHGRLGKPSELAAPSRTAGTTGLFRSHEQPRDSERGSKRMQADTDRRRLLLIGVDGATWRLLDPWLDRGELAEIFPPARTARLLHWRVVTQSAAVFSPAPGGEWGSLAACPPTPKAAATPTRPGR